MAYAPTAVAPRIAEFKQEAGRPARRSFWRRLADAVAESNKRRAEREIARYLGGPGSKFTDETEREIERRFLANSTWRSSRRK
jgi:hypothetical protein